MENITPVLPVIIGFLVLDYIHISIFAKVGNTTKVCIVCGLPKCRFLFWYHLAIKETIFINLSMILRFCSANCITKNWKWYQYRQQVTYFLSLNSSVTTIRSMIILSYFTNFFANYHFNLTIFSVNQTIVPWPLSGRILWKE